MQSKWYGPALWLAVLALSCRRPSTEAQGSGALQGGANPASPPAASGSAASGSAGSAPVSTVQLALSAPPLQNDWPLATGDYQNTRFSALDQITADNVSRLGLSWSFPTGRARGHEAAPLVVGATMYVVTPYPTAVYALDLRAPPGNVKWRYDVAPMDAAQGVACCDVVNRGPAFSEGKLFINTLDDHTIALDAATGRELWNTRLGDINRGETITMAPLVVRHRVLAGNSGGEFGVRGWLTALDTETGAIAWRAYSTGPDADVLIGPGFHPFYASDRGRDLGVTSWPPDRWQIGGGTVWGFLAYDPDLDLIYYGTGNPGPWNAELRPGDNKWTCGIFARHPDSGEAVWFYQWSPHDLFDHDGVNESILLDLPVGTTKRKVLVHPERNGYVYVLDRTTGEVLSATPFAHITSTRGVDLATGALLRVPEKTPGFDRVVRDICPAAPGAKDWQPSSYSPQTGLLYIPHNNLCEEDAGTEANYIAGTPYLGVEVKMYAGPGGHRGQVTAWDPIAQRSVWTIPEKFPAWSGTVATAGGLVFYGTMEGWFKAIDARSGRELWRFKTESGIIGQPVSYRGPDGKQYIAVLSGVGGWAGGGVAAALAAADPTAGLGFVGAMGDLPSATTPGGRLYVFGLPE
jgi:PQQ-dependent dehydrogenase (methanol/ethanol family)